jgi:type VI secretion system secreted protein VgrG
MAGSHSRHMVLHCPLGSDELEVRHLHGVERLSQCFEYVLTLYSKSPNIKAEQLLGQSACVTVTAVTQPVRAFDGIIAEFEYTGHVRNHWTYRMVLRPWLWLLSRNNNCRIFQTQTTLEIAYSLLKPVSSDVEDQLLYTLKPREYCVQYHESDLTFLMRLFEDEGIYFYFKHDINTHKLIIVDSPNAHETVPKYETIDFRGYEAEGDKPSVSFSSWRSAKRVLPGAVAMGDYNFAKPTAYMLTSSSKPQEHDHAELEFYDYPGGYRDAAVGQDRARVRMEAISAGYETAHGRTDAVGLNAGVLFSLAKHQREVENRQYLVTEVTHDADSGMFESGGGEGLKYEGYVRAIAADVPFRPQRLTPRPIMAGPQTATVVGPEGREIWTDEYGRVKLKFHWDRLGKGDESSSCFVRVAQQWTGSAWGSLFTPRIGQEVVVEFLEGDPDRPLVTGCVYNGLNPAPYDLPKEADRTGWKSQSTPGGGVNDFNELCFVDEKGKEEIQVQAQKDLILLVKHDRTKTVKNRETNTIDGGRETTIEKFDNLTVNSANKNTTVHGQFNTVADEHYKVLQNSTQLFMKDKVYVETDGNIELTNSATRYEGNSSGKITLTASSEIAIRCGLSSITLKSDGTVQVAGLKVTVGTQGSKTEYAPTGITVSAPKVTQQGIAIHELAGPIIKIG